jgi:hypothetical protein
MFQITLDQKVMNGDAGGCLTAPTPGSDVNRSSRPIRFDDQNWCILSPVDTGTNAVPSVQIIRRPGSLESGMTPVADGAQSENRGLEARDPRADNLV